jgi:HEAT repeat protein
MKRRLFTAVVLASILLSAAAWAADSSSPKERTRQTLLYGIDSQVLEAIQGLAAARDTGYTEQLLQILREQRSTAVQKAVLDMFRDLKQKDGEGRAKEILAAGSDSPSELLVSAVTYLAAIDSSGLAPALAPLVDSSDSAAASAAIAALGGVGDSTSAVLLVAKLKSGDFPDAHRSEAILALGAMKNPAAVDELLAIAKNADEDKIRRMYAADSLGKIGDARALPVLRDMFAEKDALIRLYAASAVARFSMSEAFPLLMQGLKDESWKVREMSAKTLARQLDGGQAGQAVPILSYKAEWDPVPQVRMASIQALGEIGGNEADSALLSLYSGQSRPPETREAALGALAAHSPSAAIDAARATVAAGTRSVDQLTLLATARVISTLKDGQLKEIYLKLLDNPDPIVRSYAVRGIAENHFADLRERLKKIAESDPNAATRAEAAKGLSKM